MVGQILSGQSGRIKMGSDAGEWDKKALEIRLVRRQQLSNGIPEIQSKAEQWYIFKRTVKAKLNSLCFYICRIFPIKKNLISVCTFEGKGGFGCNPKYVVQELHRQRTDLEFVWLVNDMTKEFPEYVRKVPNTVWSRAYWLTRSKVWIDNYRKPYGTVKRNGQYYINVNHYTSTLKCVGLWRGKGFSRMAYIVSKNDSDMIDALVTDSDFCEDMCHKGLVYEGNCLRTGAPRCDALFGNRDESKKRIRQKHDLPVNSKIVMFAPTFREGAKNGVRSVYSEVWSIDFERLIKKLEIRFGGEWYICIRVHPQLAATFDDYDNKNLNKRIINESKNDDMYEVLAGMDAYITDYSSACFEAASAYIPVFLYADDISRYREDRGALFWEIREDNRKHIKCDNMLLPEIKAELPFDIAVNNDELDNLIEQFDADEYRTRVDQFNKDINLTFDGKAGSRLANEINKMMETR